MNIRIDCDDRSPAKPFRIVFLDLERDILESQLPAVTAKETSSRDGYLAMRVKMQNPLPDGTVYEIPDGLIRLARHDYTGTHAVLNSILVFRGLLSFLRDIGISIIAAECRENGPGSELATRVAMGGQFGDGFQFPEEVLFPERFYEGATHRVAINKYERNPKARERCLQYWGKNCTVCGFDFGRVYGLWAEGYIHVHHLKPLSEISEEYEIDPIADLRPICPNCHAMIHWRTPPFSIEELKKRMKEESGSPASCGKPSATPENLIGLAHASPCLTSASI
jgi:hypothetical protein